MEFGNLNLASTLQACISSVIVVATPIQTFYWNKHLQPQHPTNKQVTVLTSPTGSGKTLAYLLPALSCLFGCDENVGVGSLIPPIPGSPYVVIVAPTRELVLQVLKEAEAFIVSTNDTNSQDMSTKRDPNVVTSQGWLKALCLYGGVPPYHQRRVLQQGVHMVVSTPGRLGDLLSQGIVRFDHLKHIILDEIDRLLEKQNSAQVNLIMHQVIKYIPQVVMVSATLPAWLYQAQWEKDVTSSDSFVKQHKLILDVEKQNADLFHQEGVPWLASFDSINYYDARPMIKGSNRELGNGVVPMSIQLHVHVVDADRLPFDVFTLLSCNKINSIDLNETHQSHGDVKEVGRANVQKAEDITYSSCKKTIVFLPTRVQCEQVASTLRYQAARSISPYLESRQSRWFIETLHAGMPQSERFSVLKNFTDISPHMDKSTCTYEGDSSQYVLCVTDVAARGLHINNVTQVLIALSPRCTLADLVHKVGRVGRLGSDDSSCDAHILVFDPQSASIAADLLVANGYSVSRDINQLINQPMKSVPENDKHATDDANGMRIECIQEGSSEDMLVVAKRVVASTLRSAKHCLAEEEGTRANHLWNTAQLSSMKNLDTELLLFIVESSLETMTVCGSRSHQVLSQCLLSSFKSSIRRKWPFLKFTDSYNHKADVSNRVQQWIQEVVHLHITAVQQVLLLLEQMSSKVESSDSTTTTNNPSYVPELISSKNCATVVTTEGAEGLGGLSQLLPKLLGLLLPTLLPQYHVLVIASMDKHYCHQSHVNREAPRQRKKKTEKWRNEKAQQRQHCREPDRTRDNRGGIAGVTSAGEETSEIPQSSSCSNLDCGYACYLQREARILQSEIDNYKAPNTNLKRKCHDNGRESTSHIATNPFSLEYRSAKLSSLNVLSRKGGFSSATKSKAFLSDIRSLSQGFTANTCESSDSVIGLSSVVMVGLNLCGLAALRACSVLTLFNSDGEQLKPLRTNLSTLFRTALLLGGGGCLPDSTGDHLRTKSVYSLGSHRFSAFELYENFESISSAVPDKWVSHILCGMASLLKTSNISSSRYQALTIDSLHRPSLSHVSLCPMPIEQAMLMLSSLTSSMRGDEVPIILAMSEVVDVINIPSNKKEYSLSPTQVLLSVKDQMVDLLSQASFYISLSLEQESPLCLYSPRATSSSKKDENQHQRVDFSTELGQEHNQVQVELLSVSPDQFMKGGYAKEHYVSSLPDVHSICYELVVTYSQEPIAFIAFGVSNCGDAIPWLPFRRSKFDIAQVDRLVVLSKWRGYGAKELLLRIGGSAFHQLGLPCRIKTASELAHKSFSKCELLQFEGHRAKNRSGTGRGCREGWVYWFVGEHIKDPVTGDVYSFL